MKIRITMLVSLCACLTACSSEPRAQNLSIEPIDGQIDLAESIAGDWDSVCFLGPYTTNGRARGALGVPVDVEGRSTIFSSDSIALAVTMKGDAVVDLFEIPLRPSNFAEHHGECFARSNAKFRVPVDGYPYASHISQVGGR